MATGITILEGQTIRLTATFKVNGVATDPTTVTLKIKSPSGTTTTFLYSSGGVSKSGTGVYYKDYKPTETTFYHYRWIGTGAADGVGEAAFTVAPSFID